MLFPFQSDIKPISFNKFNKVDVQYNFNKYPRFAFYQNSYYFLYDGLYSMDMSSRSWNSMKGADNISIEGCSMTSTSEGLVIYGGKHNDTYSSQMWIFSDAWHPIAGNQIACAHHASCFIPSSSALLVHGGIDQNGIRSDCLLINLMSGSTTKIALSQNLSFSHHTITLINDSTVYLFGGMDKDKHLNPNLYSIDIKTGNVQLISQSTETLQSAMRCCHQAFNFFDFFCVAGGFQFGTNLYNLALYDSIHKAWLEISFDDFLSDAWFVSFEEKMLRIFDKRMKNTRELYFTQNLEPFVDVNDPQLFNFISRLLNYNIANNFFNLNESDLMDLLNRIETLRNEVVEKYSIKQQNNNLGKIISDLTSEKEQLERAIISLNDDYEEQQLKIDKKKAKTSQIQIQSNGNSCLPPSSPPDMSIIQKIDDLKKDMKRKIEQMQGRINQNMAAIEKACPYYVFPTKASQLTFNKEDLPFIQKVTDLQQIKKENEEVNKQLENLQNRIDDMKMRKRSINKSVAEGFAYLQDISNEIYKVRAETAKKKKDFYQLQRLVIQRQFIENAMEIDSIPKNPQIQSLITKLKTLEGEKNRYDEIMPRLISQLDNHLKNILNSSSPTNEVNKALELITEIKSFHSESQNSVNEILKGSGTSKNSRNEKWGNYYNDVLNIVSRINDTEAKSVQ